MTTNEQNQLKTIRAEFKKGTPVPEIAKLISVSNVGFPHRVVALLRKECQYEK